MLNFQVPCMCKPWKSKPNNCEKCDQRLELANTLDLVSRQFNLLSYTLHCLKMKWKINSKKRIKIFLDIFFWKKNIHLWPATLLMLCYRAVPWTRGGGQRNWHKPLLVPFQSNWVARSLGTRTGFILLTRGGIIGNAFNRDSLSRIHFFLTDGGGKQVHTHRMFRRTKPHWDHAFRRLHRAPDRKAFWRTGMKKV